MSDREPSTSRRRFLASGAAAIAMGAHCHAAEEAFAERRPTTPAYSDLLSRLRTPSKHPKLVLEASYQKGAYEALEIDVPFVFAHEGRYGMNHFGFDGVGYRALCEIMKVNIMEVIRR